MASQPPPQPAQPRFVPYDPERAARQHRLKVLALSLVVLAGFLGAQAVLLSRWISVDTRPPAWDQAIHLETALDCQRAKAAGRSGDCWRPVPKPGMPPFPPLYHLALQPAMSSADPPRAALWVNFAYFCLLTLCVFGVVFHFRNDWAAAAGAVAFVCAPGVQELLYTPLIDLPVAACAAAAFWAFLESQEFHWWPSSLAFGLFFGLGMLHKWSFFSYMVPAYVVGLRALLSPAERKGPALAAAAVAAAVCLPWYWMNWPLLLPRLVQASSDFAVPVWKGAAFLTYFWSSFGGLGPLLWFMGWVGIIVPKYRRNEDHGWLVPFSVACSYVFWAIVPNRQLRFLMPGLTGLAVMATGTWPAVLIVALLGSQVFLAVNFARGLIGPFNVPTPFGVTTQLGNDPPKREDWKIDEILREAEARRDPSSPVADLVLIANHERFNGATFTYRTKALALEHVRMRGVNKRLCELAQFVLLKGGDLGPKHVIEGLPKAAAVVSSKDSWFARGYAEAASWPLPDGSKATLYERSKPGTPPFKLKAPLLMQFYTQGTVKADNLLIDLGRWDPNAGVYPLAKVSARELDVRGLRVAGAAIEAEDVFFVSAAPPGGDEWEEVRLLKLKTLRVRSLSMTAEALRGFLAERVKELKLDALRLDGTIKASGTFRNIPVAVELSVEHKTEAPRALLFRFVSLKLAGTPLPVAAINRIKELTVPLEANPETPFSIELAGLTLKDDRLTVP
jgi:hypothetical protein